MSATPEQLHEMLKYCMELARTMLEDSGDFYPFGATLSPQGVVAAVGGYNGEERPSPTEIYQLLGQSFRGGAARGEHAGVALAANVNVPPEYSSPSRDGLRVHLESQGYARFIYVPYQLGTKGLFKKRRVVEFSEPFSVELSPTFFAQSGDAFQETHRK
jgi:hypothetical protein